MRFELLMAGDC